MLSPSEKALRLVLSIVLPPISVYRQVGFGRPFWGNAGLTLLGYVPGVIHALWISFRR